MFGFEEIDWELVSDYAKRFAGIIIAALLALAARRKARSGPEQEPEAEAGGEEAVVEVPAIEPGTDAAKLASRYSRPDSSRHRGQAPSGHPVGPAPEGQG